MFAAPAVRAGGCARARALRVAVQRRPRLSAAQGAGINRGVSGVLILSHPPHCRRRKCTGAAYGRVRGPPVAANSGSSPAVTVAVSVCRWFENIEPAPTKRIDEQMALQPGDWRLRADDRLPSGGRAAFSHCPRAWRDRRASGHATSPRAGLIATSAGAARQRRLRKARQRFG